MHILIANDDGYLAPGLAALHRALSPLGRVTVVAPEQNHSGASNSLTLQRPLSVFEATDGAQKGFRFVNGKAICSVFRRLRFRKLTRAGRTSTPPSAWPARWSSAICPIRWTGRFC